jgi:hypothetical protein
MFEFGHSNFEIHVVVVYPILYFNDKNGCRNPYLHARVVLGSLILIVHDEFEHAVARE